VTPGDAARATLDAKTLQALARWKKRYLAYVTAPKDTGDVEFKPTAAEHAAAVAFGAALEKGTT
jgi:hypothetical protein